MLTPRLKELARLYKAVGDLGDDLDNFFHNSARVLQTIEIIVEEQIAIEGGEIDDDLNVVAKE